ncbi:hypothetical protein GCM10023261_10180 [Bartonella jaculi]|uniref:Uncharacterized protein n=1 Tax=Bartonella jaculi TaxID=686226 RepID=A0ABP9N756_9HYPH
MKKTRSINKDKWITITPLKFFLSEKLIDKNDVSLLSNTQTQKTNNLIREKFISKNFQGF